METRDRQTTREELNRLLSDEELGRLQLTTLQYYLHESNPANGLVRDKTDPSAPSQHRRRRPRAGDDPVLVERGVISREFAPEFVLKRLRFFRDSPQGPEPDATGLPGLLLPLPRHEDRAPRLGLRALDDRLGLPVRRDAHLRRLLRRRTPRRRPKSAAWPTRSTAAPTGSGRRTAAPRFPTAGSPRPASSRTAGPATTRRCCSTCSASARRPSRCRPRATPLTAPPTSWKEIYGRELLYSGPLFTHQLSHLWIDFRGIRDAFMREHGSDYFENSRQATYVHQEYALRNPLEFAGYGEFCWGITATDGPGWEKRTVNGIERQFYDYFARGAPFGPDDGTLAPWVVVASLPFAPEIVIPTIRAMARLDLGMTKRYGFKPSFNQTYAVPDSPTGWWVTPYHFGIDQGPVVLMIENYRTGLIWNIMRRSPYIIAGLRRAGFTGGWL